MRFWLLESFFLRGLIMHQHRFSIRFFIIVVDKSRECGFGFWFLEKLFIPDFQTWYLPLCTLSQSPRSKIGQIQSLDLSRLLSESYFRQQSFQEHGLSGTTGPLPAACSNFQAFLLARLFPLGSVSTLVEISEIEASARIEKFDPDTGTLLFFDFYVWNYW